MNNQVLDILKLVWPVVLIQLALQIYALIDLATKKKTKNLDVWIWAVIIVLGEILGPIAYFMLGKSDD